jgi:hypothetical protein
MMWVLLPWLVSGNLFVPLKNFRETQYYSDIVINDQTFSVIFDTGSSNIWIPSSQCLTQGCLQHNRYNVMNSTRFIEQSSHGLDKFEIVYGTGKIQGELVEESLSFGEHRIDHQLVGLVNKEEGSAFYQAPFSGILGLGLVSPAS